MYDVLRIACRKVCVPRSSANLNVHNGVRLCLRKQLKLSYFNSNFSNCRMTPFVFFETSAETAANRERELIEEKMNLWIEAIDALNAECRAFSYNYFNKDRSENFITKKERLMKKLKTAEKNCRRDLAMQIALCVTRGEYAEIDMGNHGQVIDWLVRQPFSSDENRASRWAWVKERNDVICCNPGPYAA